MAEHREREARLEEKADDGNIKEINDNRYYYWQWREGDSATSKYKGPVNLDE